MNVLTSLFDILVFNLKIFIGVYSSGKLFVTPHVAFIAQMSCNKRGLHQNYFIQTSL